MTVLFYTIFYILFAAGIVYPPGEFVAIGLTITELFSAWLGNEFDAFIQYHIKRSSLTLLVHSLLPFGYIAGLSLFGHVQFGLTDEIWLSILLCALTGPLYVVIKLLIWSRNNWSKHPIAQRLAIYCNNDNNYSSSSWMDIAAGVNREYQRIDKLQIKTNNTSKIVVMQSWIVKVSPYKLDIANQTNSVLVMYNVNIYSSNPLSTAATTAEAATVNGDRVVDAAVYAKYRIVTRQPGGENFTIRIHVREVATLLDTITMPQRSLTSVQLPKMLREICISVIKDAVEKNPPYKSTLEMEQCVVCMNTMANVKLLRQCPNIPAIDDIPACGDCHCPPIYCIDCLAKWFLTGDLQEKEPSEIISSKSSCPQCRAIFCILDVAYIINEQHQQEKEATSGGGGDDDYQSDE